MPNFLSPLKMLAPSGSEITLTSAHAGSRSNEYSCVSPFPSTKIFFLTGKYLSNRSSISLSPALSGGPARMRLLIQLSGLSSQNTDENFDPSMKRSNSS